MFKKRRLAMRILSMLLAFNLCIMLVPADVRAWPGPILDTDPYVESTVISQDGWKVAKLWNDYISFEINAGTETVARTVPTKYYSGSLRKACEEQFIYQELTFSAEYEGEEEKILKPKTAEVYAKDGYLSVSYTFKNSNITCDVFFSIIETGEGRLKGFYNIPITKDSYLEQFGEDVHGRTFIIMASADFTVPDRDRGGVARMYLKNHNMQYFGRENESRARKLLLSVSNMSEGRHESEITDITDGLEEFWPDGAGEVGVTGYDEANPFVMLGHQYNPSAFYRYGVQGFLPGGGAASVSYIPRSGRLSAVSGLLMLHPQDSPGRFEGDLTDTISSYQYWGYRNLYKTGETVLQQNEYGVVLDSEYEDVVTNAAMLAIVPSSRYPSGYMVKELAATDRIPENAVTVFRGSFAWEGQGGYYEFGSGTAYLSPTVSANYDADSGGYFRLEPDGTIRYNEIRLSVPAFCFYVSKGNGKEPEFSYDDEKGLVIKLDPQNNAAYTKVDIPYARTSIEGASANVRGDIIFSGGIRFQTVFDSAKFALSQLSMGNDEHGKFTLNGLEAELDVKDVSMFGLGIDKAYGKINTMTDYYKFDVKVDAYQVFQFEAALELMRTKDGTLMPNSLWGALNVPAQGLPLVPPAPVAEITGGGIGFNDLVSTVNGDYLMIPPISLTMAANMKILKVIQGKGTVTAGPGGISLTGSNLSIPDSNGIRLVDELSLSFHEQGMKKRYKGHDYVGVNLKGGLGAKMSILNRKKASGSSRPAASSKKDVHISGQGNAEGKDSEGRDWGKVITLEGNMNLSMFGGVDPYNSKLYLLVDTTGKAKAELNIPQFVPVIGGVNVAEAEVLMSLGAETLVPLDKSAEDAFSSAIENMNGYIGVCAQGTFVFATGRVYYVSPRTVGADVFILSEPDEFDMDKYISGHKNAGSSQAAILYDEDGEQVGIALFEDGLEEQEITVTAPEEEADSSSDENAAAAEAAPDEQTDEEAEEPDEEPDEEETGLSMTAAKGGTGSFTMMSEISDELEDAEDPDAAPEAEDPADEDAADTEDTAEAADEGAVTAEEGVEEGAEEPDEETAAEAAVEEGAEEGAEEDAESVPGTEEVTEEAGDGRSAKKESEAAGENTLQVTLKEGASLTPEDVVILVVNPAEEAGAVQAEAFLAGLTVNGVPVTEIEMNERGEVTNNGNVYVQTDSETGAVISANLCLDNTKRTWNISSGISLDPEPTLYINSKQTFEALRDVSFTGGTLRATAANLHTDARYELHTYMGREPGSGEYGVGEPIPIEVSEGKSALTCSVEVPTEGEAAESGDYYVSTALVKIMTGDFNGDGTVTDDEVTQVALDRWESTSTVHYTNVNTPAAPASALIEAGGNETLICTFDDVTGVDGYRVRIFKDGKDTGYGYNFPVKKGTDPESGDTIDTLDGTGVTGAVLHEGGTYTVRLAPTVGGQQITEGTEDIPAILEPGSGYAVGVSTYRYVDREEMQYPLYSMEVMSNEETVSPYKPAELTVKLDGREVQRDSRSGIYEGVVSKERCPELEISVVSDGNYEISAALETEGDDSPVVYTQDGPVFSELLGIDNGAVMYDIVVTNKATKDRTAAFLRLCFDDVPPVLLLDADRVMMDADGKYTISGVTEAGAEVNGVTADQNGRFTLTDVLREEYGILKEKGLYWEEIENFTHQIEDEESFAMAMSYYEDKVTAGRYTGYTVEPAAFSGPGDYTVTYREVQRNFYSDSFYTQLQEEEARGEILNLTVTESEEELTGEDLDDARGRLDPDYQTLTEDVRQTLKNQNVTVTATDTGGNKTTARVLVTSHFHKLKAVAAVPGDCTHKGTKAHYVCTLCGEVFEDEDGLIPAGDLSTPVQPNSHSYGSWKQTKAPTALAEGVRSRSCTRCGHTENRPVAKLAAKISLAVGKIKVDKTTIPLKKSQKFAKIQAEMTAGDRLKEAKSSKPKLVQASVNASTGKIALRAYKKTGKAKITVTTAAGASTTFTVKVQSKKVTAKKIVGFKKTVKLKKGGKYQISRDVSPVTTPDKMKFKSSDKKIASVSKKGLITAKKKGKATITVTIGKRKFKCKVNVSKGA